MTNPTHPEKRIHTKSFRHVETERLIDRLHYIRVNLVVMRRAADQKVDVRTLAREVVNCERELEYRCVGFEPVSDAIHLDAVPVTSMNRLMRPPEGRRRARSEGT